MEQENQAEDLINEVKEAKGGRFIKKNIYSILKERP